MLEAPDLDEERLADELGGYALPWNAPATCVRDRARCP